MSSIDHQHAHDGVPSRTGGSATRSMALRTVLVEFERDIAGVAAPAEGDADIESAY